MEGSEQRDAREGTRVLLYGWCQIESPCRGPLVEWLAGGGQASPADAMKKMLGLK